MKRPWLPLASERMKSSTSWVVLCWDEDDTASLGLFLLAAAATTRAVWFPVTVVPDARRWIVRRLEFATWRVRPVRPASPGRMPGLDAPV